MPLIEMPHEIEDARAKLVKFDNPQSRHFDVYLTDGRMLSIPIKWYPRLQKANHRQRSEWELVGGGIGLHWEEIDEDLSVAGFLMGWKAPDGEY